MTSGLPLRASCAGAPMQPRLARHHAPFLAHEAHSLCAAAGLLYHVPCTRALHTPGAAATSAHGAHAHGVRTPPAPLCLAQPHGAHPPPLPPHASPGTTDPLHTGHSLLYVDSHPRMQVAWKACLQGRCMSSSSASYSSRHTAQGLRAGGGWRVLRGK